MNLNFDKIQSFLQCPLRYHFQYEEEAEPEFVTADQLFGRVMHTTLFQYGHDLILAEESDPEALRNQFLNLWAEALQNHPRVKFGKLSAEDYEARGFALIGLFCETYVPQQVVGINERIAAHLQGIPFDGCIDWLEENTNGTTLVEFKTASRKPAEHSQSHLEMALYALAFRELNPDDSLKFRVVTLVKTRQPQVHIQNLELEDTHLALAQMLLEGVHHALQSGARYPTPSYLCPRCPYQDRCQKTIQNKNQMEEIPCLSRN